MPKEACATEISHAAIIIYQYQQILDMFTGLTSLVKDDHTIGKVLIRIIIAMELDH